MAPAPKYSHQEQEDLILNAAADCIWESSLTDFTMSAVSRTANLSMGSIYKHVKCKEDIIFALAERTFSRMKSAFEQVLALDLTTPEKMVAIALISPAKIQVYPFDSQLEAMVTNEAIIKRASSLWTDRMFESHQRCERAFRETMQQAALSGEVDLPGDRLQSIEEFNQGCWAMMVGFEQLQRVVQLRAISEGTADLAKGYELDSPLIKNMHRLINSYHWVQPLTAEGIDKASLVLKELELR